MNNAPTHPSRPLVGFSGLRGGCIVRQSDRRVHIARQVVRYGFLKLFISYCVVTLQQWLDI